MSEAKKPDICDFIVEAIRATRRKNLPSAVRPEQIWNIVKAADIYTESEYANGMRRLIFNNTVFCHGTSQYSGETRNQRITARDSKDFNFQEKHMDGYNNVRLTIYADGLTNDGKSALEASLGGGKALKKAKGILEKLQNKE